MEAVPESSTLPSSGVVVPTIVAPGIRSIWGDHIGTSSAKSAGPTDLTSGHPLCGLYTTDQPTLGGECAT